MLWTMETLYTTAKIEGKTSIPQRLSLCLDKIRVQRTTQKTITGIFFNLPNVEISLSA